jgi:FkbH-like protein
MPLDDRGIAIAATFTAEAIQPAMAFWAGELGLDCPIRFTGYSQLFQTLLNPSSLFARNRSGYNVALVRFEDWLTAGMEDSALRLAEALRSTVFNAPLIVAACPATPAHAPACAEAEELVRRAVALLPAVYWISSSEIVARYPVAEVHDPHADELGHVPYTPEFFAALATAVARQIHALALPPYKVIALDCDDTLWAGVCGEDGPEGVVLDGPRRALQTFMKERREAGMLLALSSKNNEQDVFETFRAHPEMPLSLNDFAARRIDWGSKSANLAELAEELGLGLDTVILVDDNPKECREAQAGVPEVLTLALPEGPEQIPAFLEHVWAFDHPRVTAEDRARSETYAQQASRARAERSAGSLAEFLASLELAVTIAPMEAADLPRVSQLTLRTNQMNATCVRRSEAEIQALSAHEMDAHEILTVRVCDRFGDYGLTGVMIFCTEDDTLAVDTFLLSCRALGRGVEHRMVARLGEIARDRGLKRVILPFVAAQRNRPARLFLESIGAPELIASAAAAVRYQPGHAPALEQTERAERTVRSAVKRPDYVRIATELRVPRAVLARCQTVAVPVDGAARRAQPPRTPLERELADLWSELLHRQPVGIHDNFFALGGHSLLAVQLLSRVRQTYGVDLTLAVVYSGDFTVAELGKAVELKELEQSGGAYRELLEELAGLSEDEVRALLAQEQDAS